MFYVDFMILVITHVFSLTCLFLFRQGDLENDRVPVLLALELPASSVSAAARSAAQRCHVHLGKIAKEMLGMNKAARGSPTYVA